MPVGHAAMRFLLNSWVETYLIFDDHRTCDETWEDVGASLKKIGARQMRKKAEKGNTKSYTKVLNKIIERMQGTEVGDMKYNFCSVVSGEKRRSLLDVICDFLW